MTRDDFAPIFRELSGYFSDGRNSRERKTFCNSVVAPKSCGASLARRIIFWKEDGREDGRDGRDGRDGGRTKDEGRKGDKWVSRYIRLEGLLGVLGGQPGGVRRREGRARVGYRATQTKNEKGGRVPEPRMSARRVLKGKRAR